MLAVILSSVAVVIALLYLVFSLRFHLNLKRDLNYSLARIFLKSSSIYAFITLVVSILLFTAGRIMSFEILFGVLPEDVILFVRSPIELLATVLLTVSLVMLCRITRRVSES